MQQKRANRQQMKIIITRLFPTRKIKKQEVILSRQMRKQQQQLQRWKLTQIQRDQMNLVKRRARKIPHCRQH